MLCWVNIHQVVSVTTHIHKVVTCTSDSLKCGHLPHGIYAMRSDALELTTTEQAWGHLKLGSLVSICYNIISKGSAVVKGAFYMVI